ncbi:hypothetical protein ACRTDU_10665 [Sunxiuqinia elliptica]
MNSKNAFKIVLGLIFLIFLNKTSNGQIGSSISFATDKVLGLNIFYTKNNNSFYLGYSYQFNGQKNTVVNERKKTYGTTPIENGDFYSLVDLGYSRLFFNQLTVQPEVSFGSKKYFTSYSDKRFKDDGYSLVNSSETLTGIGVNLGYKINDLIEPFCGFHTIKKLNFGVRIHIDIY